MELINIIFKSIYLLVWAIVGIGASIGAVHHPNCSNLAFFSICGVANLAIQGYFFAKHVVKLVASIKLYIANKKAK